MTTSTEPDTTASLSRIVASLDAVTAAIEPETMPTPLAELFTPPRRAAALPGPHGGGDAAPTVGVRFLFRNDTHTSIRCTHLIHMRGRKMTRIPVDSLEKWTLAHVGASLFALHSSTVLKHVALKLLKTQFVRPGDVIDIDLCATGGFVTRASEIAVHPFETHCLDSVLEALKRHACLVLPPDLSAHARQAAIGDLTALAAGVLPGLACTDLADALTFHDLVRSRWFRQDAIQG